MFAGLCFVVRAGLNMGQDRQLPGGSTHDRHIFQKGKKRKDVVCSLNVFKMNKNAR